MRALVVGAGPAGLACAIGLRQLGVDVTVCDRAADVVNRGAAIGLWWNGITALHRLGVAPGLLLDRVVIRRARYRNAAGRLLTEFPSVEFFADIPETFVAVHRSELQRALLSEVDGADLRFGTGVGRLDPDPQGVTAHLSDGTSLHAQLLVGADGLRSNVRRALLSAAPPRDTGMLGWTGVAALDTDGSPDAFEHLASAAGGFFFAPIRAGETFWGAITRARPSSLRADARAGKRAGALQHFHGWWPRVRELISATEESRLVSFTVYEAPTLNRYVAGRAVLVGDAAHAMAPHLAQGTCQALEDAVTLVDCLADGTGVQPALDDYQRRRLRRTQTVAALSRWYARTLRIQDPLLRLAGPARLGRPLRHATLSAVRRVIAPRESVDAG